MSPAVSRMYGIALGSPEERTRFAGEAISIAVVMQPAGNGEGDRHGLVAILQGPERSCPGHLQGR